MAEPLLADYVKEHPTSSWGWYALGYSQFAQKKVGESIQSLAKCLQLDVSNAEAHKILEDTKARRMGLLLPEQFHELRERCESTQKEMGEIFQVGEKSWTRWETGKHRPSRSISLLVRALYDGELSVNYLLKRAGKALREQLATLLYLRRPTSRFKRQAEMLRQSRLAFRRSRSPGNKIRCPRKNRASAA